MKGNSHRVLKSIALLTKPTTKSTASPWADKQVAINLFGADGLAADIGIVLIRKGVSMLRIYDPAQVVHRHQNSSPVSMYEAIALARLLAQEVGNPQTRIMGYPFRFDPVTAFPSELIIVINADHHPGTFDSDYLHAAQTPYLWVALSPDGEQGTVVVHRVQPDMVDCAAKHARHGEVVQALTANTMIDVSTHLAALVGEAAESMVAGCDPPWRCAQVRAMGERCVE